MHTDVRYYEPRSPARVTYLLAAWLDGARVLGYNGRRLGRGEWRRLCFRKADDAMKIGPYNLPDDLYYDREHNWARVEGQTLTQGLSDFGQAIAGEIIYAEPPRTGRQVRQGDAVLSLESGKWVGRVRAMAGGQIVAGNDNLDDDPALINKDPYGAGWLARIAMSDPNDLERLMRPNDPAFAEFMAAERAKYKK